MARFSSGLVATGAGSTTTPFAALVATSLVGCTLRECGVFNTTNTATYVKLARLSTQGTPGSALTVNKFNFNSPGNNAFTVGLYTGAPTLTDAGYRTVLGATIGAGVIWTFGDTGLEIQAGVANGIGLVVDQGTGQICDWYMVWDE